MKILIADDEPVSRSVLKKALMSWGHEVVEVSDGKEAWEALNCHGGPQIALLDWIMPQMDGIDVVRKVRDTLSDENCYIYVILLTQRGSQDDIVQGLAAGADDYMVKPFNYNELQVRIRSGQRIVELQSALTAANQDLREALAHVKKLSGLLPICVSCKKIRDQKGYWQQIKAYVRDRSEAEFSHSICPECAERLYPELKLQQ